MTNDMSSVPRDSNNFLAARCSRPAASRPPLSGGSSCSPPAAAARPAGPAAAERPAALLVHGATGGSSKDTLDAHSPVQPPTSRAASSSTSRCSTGTTTTRSRSAVAESVDALRGREDLDHQAAPGRHLPQRQGRHPRGRAVHPPPRGRPQADLGRRHARADHRLRRHQEGRRQHRR